MFRQYVYFSAKDYLIMISSAFKPKYPKDPGKPLPPGFWIGIVILAILFCWMHGCQGGVSP